jgi:hypothetical protein
LAKIKLAPSVLQKNYVKGLNQYRFDSVFQLCLSLFSTYRKGTQDVEDIYQLLDDIGYSNLKDIPADEIEAIAAYVEMLLPDWNSANDPERRTFLLAAAIQRRDLLVVIDEEVVNDLGTEILIAPDSIISFIDKRKISDITFTTL